MLGTSKALASSTPARGAFSRAWGLAILASVVVLLLATILISNFIKAGGPHDMIAQRNACMHNQLGIQAAKESWAAESKATPGTPVEWTNILGYLKNSMAPACPAGGTYALGVTGTNATCSDPRHRFPANASDK